MKLENKTILITGASSGIGRELAVQLAAMDNRLLLVARRVDLLNELVKDLPLRDDQHFIYPCDVSDPEAVRLTCRTILEENLQPDVLILNAGKSAGYSVHNINIRNIRDEFNVNFFHVVEFLHYLLPQMLLNGSGMVAATASLAGYRGMPRAAGYAASKAALINFMESLRIDLWGTGIKSVLISPGFVESEITAKNRYRMPFLMATDKAVRIIIKGLEKEKVEIHFPYRLSLPAKLSRLLPKNLYAYIMRKGRND